MSSLKCVIKSLQHQRISVDISFQYFFFNISWSDRARLSCNRSTFRHRELPARDMGDWVCNHRYARVGTWTYLPASKSATCDPWYVAILAHARTHIHTWVRIQRARSCEWSSASHGTQSIIWSKESLNRKMIKEGIGR